MRIRRCVVIDVSHILTRGRLESEVAGMTQTVVAR